MVSSRPFPYRSRAPVETAQLYTKEHITSSVIGIALLVGLAWCALYTTLGGKPLGGWTESPSL